MCAASLPIQLRQLSYVRNITYQNELKIISQSQLIDITIIYEEKYHHL